jgi:Mn-dependent DtxR family transcriptional regulator
MSRGLGELQRYVLALAELHPITVNDVAGALEKAGRDVQRPSIARAVRRLAEDGYLVPVSGYVGVEITYELVQEDAAIGGA